MSAISNRIEYIDIFRYMTVTFAIISHVIIHFDIYDELSPDVTPFLKSITRSATPSLLILFGMMVEIVYSRKFQASESRSIGAILYRSFLCYLAFVGLAALDLVFVSQDAVKFVGAGLLISHVEFANIFKIYAILLLLVPPLLIVRMKWGILGLSIVAAGAFFSHSLLFSQLELLPRPLHHLGGFMFGIGGEWGPTILHALGLTVFGMILASALLPTPTLRGSRAIASAVTLASLAFLAVTLFSEGALGLANNIADSTKWRDNNHIGYYAFGVTATIVLLGLSFLAITYMPKIVRRPAQTIGGATMIYFFVANGLLKIVPATTAPPLWVGLLLIILILVVSGAFTLAWVKLGRRVGPIAALNEQGPIFLSKLIQRSESKRISGTQES